MWIAFKLADDELRDVNTAIANGNDQMVRKALSSRGFAVTVAQPGGDAVFAWRIISDIRVLDID